MSGYIYSTVVLYRGEIFKNEKLDCWDFDSVTDACKWLVEQNYSVNMQAARTGLYNLLNGKIRHYKGFTISVAYTNPDRTF